MQTVNYVQKWVDENALSEYGGNYTDEERTQLEETLKRIEEALTISEKPMDPAGGDNDKENPLDENKDKENPADGNKDKETPATGNKDGSSPQMGDDANIAFWGILMMASGAALNGIVLCGRKKKYNR